MQFSCSTQKMIEALQIATKALSNRTGNPILEGILIEAANGQITLTCSDERLTIVTSIEADIQEEGRGIVPGKLFTEIIRRLQDGTLAIDMNERFVFTIRSAGSRTNISGQDGDLYPMLPRLENEREISLPQDLLRDMIQKTEFAISPDDMREVLTGALLEIADGNITMVALDGYRLALRRALGGDLPDRLSAIIPGRAIGEIGKLLSDQPDAFAQLSFAGNKLHIGLDETDIYVILVEGEYVQYRQILPKAFATRVEVELERFRRCIDRAALIAREGSNNLILLRIDEGTMVIEAHSQIGDVREEMEVLQEGAGIRIAFNVKYMSDVVRYIDAERIELNMNNPVSPCIITPVDDRNYLHLILPVRTGGK